MTASKQTIREELRKDQEQIKIANKNHREQLAKMKTIISSVFGIFGLLSMLYIMLEYFQSYLQSTTIHLIIATLTVVASFFYGLNQVIFKATDTLDDINDSHKQVTADIADLIEQKLDNSTTVLSTTAGAVRAGAKLMENVRTSGDTSAEAALIYVGIPSLSSTSDTETGASTEDERFFEKYSDEATHLNATQAPMVRMLRSLRLKLLSCGELISKQLF